jgi:hypothetical protein
MLDRERLAELRRLQEASPADGALRYHPAIMAAALDLIAAAERALELEAQLASMARYHEERREDEGRDLSVLHGVLKSAEAELTHLRAVRDAAQAAYYTGVLSQRPLEGGGVAIFFEVRYESMLALEEALAAQEEADDAKPES